MKLTLRLDPSRVRHWHLRLAERLASRADTQVCVGWGQAGAPLPSAVDLLFRLERLIHRVPSGDVTVSAAPPQFARFAATENNADLVLDFTGAPAGAGHARTGHARSWLVAFDGVADEAAVLAALLEKRTPVVTITDAQTGAIIVSGHPGTERADAIVLALGDVLARTATLIVAALGGAAAKVDPAARAASLDTRKIGEVALKSLARTVLRWLYGLLYNAPHWRTGWRFVDGPDVVDLRAHPPGGWRNLSDDSTRFYADPFPVEHEGRSFVFVEDFPHKLGYGLISAVEFDANGPVGAPRPVLDIGTHLSYPFVFAHAGEMWMIPETGATGTVALYRAEAFPDRWVKHTTLLSGLVASDATLFQRDGRWWMLATVRDDGGAFSDALHVWSAPDLFGQWEPHAGNPVLVDIATARPAGRIVARGGKLIRPFQDCREGYGVALGLAEITQLDDDGFAQNVVASLRAGPLWPGRRLHTLNRAGRIECIDGSASARRF